MPRQPSPPSTRIVAEIRGRIERGVLAPGARVPSTREIVRRWKVAMATATKVLTTLRQEGLVETVPGVGTLVAGKRAHRARRASSIPPARQPRAPLHRATADAPLARPRIVAAAVAIADSEGLVGLSMRRVGVELGVATMSLYRHVSDKDDLLLDMMESVCSELHFPAGFAGDWRARVELAARLLWAGFRKHPWLASAMSLTRPQLVPSGLAYTEWVLETLDRAGLDATTTLTSHLALFNFVRGTAMNLELEAQAEAESGLDNEEWMARQGSSLDAIVAGGRFPFVARLFSTPYDFDLETLFEFGLQRFLDGLAKQVGATRRS